MDFLDCMLDPDILNEGVASLPDVPKLSAKELKEKFDYIVTELGTAYNALIELLGGADVLSAFKGYDPDGNEKTVQELFDDAFSRVSDLKKLTGAQSIGTRDVVSGSPSTVAAQLAYLYSLCKQFSADAVTLNIPEGYKPDNATHADTADYATASGISSVFYMPNMYNTSLGSILSATIALPFIPFFTLGGGAGTASSSGTYDELTVYESNGTAHSYTDVCDQFTLTPGKKYLVHALINGSLRYNQKGAPEVLSLRLSFAGASFVRTIPTTPLPEGTAQTGTTDVLSLDAAFFIDAGSSTSAEKMKLSVYAVDAAFTGTIGLSLSRGFIEIKEVA